MGLRIALFDDNKNIRESIGMFANTEQTLNWSFHSPMYWIV
jgi:hypothetical protein